MADEAVVGAEGAIETAEASAVEGLTDGATGVGADAVQDEPDHYTVFVDGKEERVTFEDLQKGYMRQADYTRKTQQLARERESLSEMAVLRDALERDPRTTIAALASALGVDFGTATKVAEAAQAGDVEPWDALAAKVDNISNQLTAQQQAALAAQQQAQSAQAMQRQIQQEIADLKSVHGEFNDAELVQYAVDHKVPDLSTAYRAWQFDLAQAQRAAEHNKAVEAKRKAQVVAGGVNTSGTVSTSAQQKMSVREAVRAAFAAAQ